MATWFVVVIKVSKILLYVFWRTSFLKNLTVRTSHDENWVLLWVSIHLFLCFGKVILWELGNVVVNWIVFVIDNVELFTIEYLLLQISISDSLSSQDLNSYLISFWSCDLAISNENLGDVVFASILIGLLSLDERLWSHIIDFRRICELVVIEISENTPVSEWFFFFFLDQIRSIILNFLLFR